MTASINVYGRSSWWVARVRTVYSSEVLILDALISDIVGTTRDPFQIPFEEKIIEARVHRGYLANAKAIQRQHLNPNAVYQVGDKVAVIEQWVVDRPSPRLGSARTPYEIEDFLTNPRPYLEEGADSSSFTQSYWVVGKYELPPNDGPYPLQNKL